MSRHEGTRVKQHRTKAAARKGNPDKQLRLAADIIAPQLYEQRYAYTKGAIANELASLWLKFGKPMIPSLSLECYGDDAARGLCSENIFSDGVSYVASRAQCGPRQIKADSYVLWSASAVPRLSNFGTDYLLRSKGQSIPTDCKNS